MKQGQNNIALLAYAFISLLTFGYSYNREYVSQTSMLISPEEVNLMSSIARGVAWPLYWSTVAFEFARPK